MEGLMSLLFGLPLKRMIPTGQDSAGAKHTLRDSRVDNQAPPFSFVIIDGIVEIDQEPDLNELLKLKWTKIAGRYMGQANAEAYGKRNAVRAELLIRMRPTKIIPDKTDEQYHGRDNKQHC
jgi:hypothetical protein